MRKPSIPSVQPVKDTVVATVLIPMKETLEIITGVRGGEINKLPEGSSLADVVTKVNEIIDRLNASGR